jgi:hypothetical protein
MKASLLMLIVRVYCFPYAAASVIDAARHRWFLLQLGL